MAGQGDEILGDTPDIAFSLTAAEMPLGEDPSGSADTLPDSAEPDTDETATQGSGTVRVATEERSEKTQAADGDAAASAETADTGSRSIVDRIVEGLGAMAPTDWIRMYAEFAVTVSEIRAQVIVTVGDVDAMVEVPEPVLELVREYRSVPQRPERGPWWRLLIHATADRVIEIDYDHGEDPFPDGQLFEPAAYRADLETFPRERVPVWLAAYIGHGGRQTRSPRRAGAAARADRESSIWSVLAENEFPPFPVLWARWATLAAAFTAACSEWGPRMLPALAWFESSRRSGATLYVLPGERAVLSGGVWDAPGLDAVYNGSATMPNFYSGAPAWVVDPVLNPRAASGLMSFCYWWEGGRWYRGESPPARECAAALPGVWTAETVAEIVTRVISPARRTAAVLTLLEAAETGVATEDTVRDAFGDGGRIDLGGALFQLRVAGVLADIPAALPEELAVLRVRQYIEGRGLDTTGYPLDGLVADRLDCGWMVYVPVPSGELAVGRAIFYIADDGVLEPSSSSVPPSRFIAEFERRFRQRRGHTPREPLRSVKGA